MGPERPGEPGHLEAEGRDQDASTGPSGSSNGGYPNRQVPPLPPPGWYVDPENRHLIRLWDGSSWSDQVVARPPSPESRVGKSASDDAARTQTVMSVSTGAFPVKPGIPAEAPPPSPATDARDGDDGKEPAVPPDQEPSTPTDSAQPSASDEIRIWAKKTGEAVALAWSVDSPEAWEDAARTATVVADTAQSIAAVNRAQRRADQVRDEAVAALQEVRGRIQEARSARRRAKEIRGVLDAARETNTPVAWREAIERIESLNHGRD